jgi:hypothetical protein
MEKKDEVWGAGEAPISTGYGGCMYKRVQSVYDPKREALDTAHYNGTRNSWEASEEVCDTRTRRLADRWRS